jgi:hypothetical protein
MKTLTLTQAEATGFFQANTKPMVIEFVLPDQEEPLEITGSRGVCISNDTGMKRLKQLSDSAAMTNKGVTNLFYQDMLFDNYDSKKKEYRLGFLRFIPTGRENDVLLRITTCQTKSQAKTVSQLYRDTKLSKKRTIRRDVPMANNTVRGMRLVNVSSDLVVDAGTATNVAIKAA